jgi:SsrA-binding protein
MDIISKNRKAYFDYQISDDLEAGLMLLGSEIKAVRAKQVNINGSYVKPLTNESGQTELWWVGSHFNLGGEDQTRSKKLLLHASEVERLVGKLSAKGYTILPLELYLKRGRAKLRIGLGTRKNLKDKREIIRKRDLDREVERELKPKG